MDGPMFVSISARPRVGNWSRYGNLYCDPLSQTFDTLVLSPPVTAPDTILPKSPSSSEIHARTTPDPGGRLLGTAGTLGPQGAAFVRLTDRLAVRPVGTGSKKEIKARRCEFGAGPVGGFKVCDGRGLKGLYESFRDRGNSLRPRFSASGILDQPFPTSFPLESLSLPAHTRTLPRGAH